MAVQPTNSKCCRCIELRTGAIVIAIMHILGAFGVLGYGILWYPKRGPGASEVVLEYGIFPSSIIGVIVGLTAGATLLIGAIKYNNTAILFHIVLAAIEIMDLFAIAIMYIIVANVADGGNFEDGFAALICYLFLIPIVFHAIIYICFLVCIYNFYKEVKSRAIIPACIT